MSHYLSEVELAEIERRGSNVSTPMFSFDDVVVYARAIESDKARLLAHIRATKPVASVEVIAVALNTLDTAITWADGTRATIHLTRAKEVSSLLQSLAASLTWMTGDLDNSNGLLDGCRHERNVLQRICVERADALEAAEAEVEKLREAIAEWDKSRTTGAELALIRALNQEERHG